MIEGLNYAGAIQGGISQPEAFRQKMEYETQMKQHLAAEQKIQHREGQLTRQLQHLEKNVSALCSVVDELNTKLSPLTVPVPEKEQAGYAHDGTPSSEVASFLERMNGQILLVIRRINSTTREIDL
jgi:hypothetical protein